jgi:F0F1-type ATP synthase delta subunit
MEKAYAQALAQVIRDGKNPHEAVVSMHSALVRSGRTSLIKKIALAFRRLMEHEAKRDTVTVFIANKDDETRARKEADHVLTQLKLSNRKVVYRVDHTLIGGWRMEGRDHLTDASYKKFLLDIYATATN